MDRKTFIILVLLAIATVCWIIFWLYDYNKDGATKKGGDLYKTIMDRGYVIVGVKTDLKPFGFIEQTGANAGFDVDIAHYIAKELFHDPSKVKFVSVSEKDRFYILNVNKVDMIIATMTITPKRQHFADFSNAYYITGQALLVNSGSRIRSLSDLSNKNIGVIFGSTAEETIKFLLPTARVMGYKSYDEAYHALKAGHVLGITSDEAILRNYSMKDSSVILLSKRYSRDSYGIAFRRGDESNYILDVVNGVLSDMEHRGVLTELKHKWNLD